MSDLEHLHFDKRNARKHNPRNLGMIEKSLGEVGAARSIVIDEDNNILAGNGTVEVAQRLGMKLQVVESDGETIIAVKRRNLTPEQKQRLAIFDNRTTDTSEFDVDVLGAILAENHDAFDGMFSKDELADLIDTILAPGDGGDEFDTTPQDGPTRVQRGELWQLGDHRLLCGDSTNAEDVERLMGGEKASAVITDPPYGMRLDADFSGMQNHLDFAQAKGIKNGRKYDNVIGDHADFDAAPIVAIFEDVKEQFWFGADYYATSLGDTQHSGAWLVWDKRLEESADKMFGSCFELIWSRQKHKRDIIRHKWAGIFGTEHEPQRGRQHPNQKPCRLLEDIITRYIKDNDIVWDGFLGSGTTLIAAQRTGRRCYGMEIDPRYADVVIKRFEAETGLLAQRVEL